MMFLPEYFCDSLRQFMKFAYQFGGIGLLDRRKRDHQAGERLSRVQGRGDLVDQLGQARSARMCGASTQLRYFIDIPRAGRA
jgi:hypothetical protein